MIRTRPNGVVVLKGKAKLLFEGDEQPVHMQPGDYINIPAHRKHRVEWTTPDEANVWLAIHYPSRFQGRAESQDI